MNDLKDRLEVQMDLIRESGSWFDTSFLIVLPILALAAMISSSNKNDQRTIRILNWVLGITLFYSVVRTLQEGDISYFIQSWTLLCFTFCIPLIPRNDKKEE